MLDDLLYFIYYYFFFKKLNFICKSETQAENLSICVEHRL